MTPIEDAWARYASTFVGLMLGTGARYGITFREEGWPKPIAVIADICMLGFLGLVAVVASDTLKLTGDSRSLVAALAALMSAKLVKRIQDRALARADRELDGLLGVAKAAEVVSVPAGVGKPEAICAQPGTPDSRQARIGNSLMSAYSSTTKRRPPEDQIEALRKLDTKP